ncbi:DNA polymerase III subunit delta [Alteromonas sp. C1M14]|uniref:DNA polymerase III subunit delta n=1 Tax=Alteromonas sp. C1M14 TaxID=2841567 RepID=UPI001C0920B4|nr:DNA polymerase III subunit delta [Alteromonas sp. C1M14]MBU2977021.1 DNA polymerase III subunit delta [Alteromonas sp. C1M14]
MQVYPNRFEQELSRQLKPCYLLFGDEPQQKFEMIDALRLKAKDAGFTERTVLVADNTFNWHQLVEATQALSLFSSQQLIELELPTGKPGKEGSQVLQTVASSLSDDLLLLIHGPRIGKDVQRSKWFKALDAIGVHSLCYPLEDKQLSNWIQQTLNKYGLQSDPTCVKMLADMCEGNLLAAKQEIEKLALIYPNQRLSSDQVEAAMVDQSRFNIFQLIDVMLAGEQSRCIKMLYRLESEGLEPNIVIWAFIREWQTLTKLQSLQLNHEPINWMRMGIWKNRQSVYQAALGRLTPEALKAIRGHIERADLAFKQNVVVHPFIKLAHLCMLFMGVPVNTIPVIEDLN